MNVINVCIIAHVDSGKSTLTSALMGCGGDISQVDVLPSEKKRGITIQTQGFKIIHGNCSINILDTPGHFELSDGSINMLNYVDLAILLIDGTQGVQAQTIMYHQAILHKKLPYIIVVNKIDHPNYDQEAVWCDINDKLVTDASILYVSSITSQGVGPLKEYMAQLSRSAEAYPTHPYAEVVALRFSSQQKWTQALMLNHGDDIEVGDQIFFNQVQKSKIYAINAHTPGVISQERIRKHDMLWCTVVLEDNYLNNFIPVKASKSIAYAQDRKIESHHYFMLSTIYPLDVGKEAQFRRAIHKLHCEDRLFLMEAVHDPLFGSGYLLHTRGALHFLLIKERMELEEQVKSISTPTRIKYLCYDTHNELLNVIVWDDFIKVSKVKEPAIAIAFSSSDNAKTENMIASAFKLLPYQRSSLELFYMVPIICLTQDFLHVILSMHKGLLAHRFISGVQYVNSHVSFISFTLNHRPWNGFNRVVNQNYALKTLNELLELLVRAIDRELYEINIRGFINNRCIVSRRIQAYSKHIGVKLLGDKSRRAKHLAAQRDSKKNLKKKAVVSINKAKLYDSLV